MGTVLAAAIAGTVALTINETVDQRKCREMETKIREEREKSYKDVIGHVLSSFGKGSALNEHDVRRDIALWASKDFIKAYDEWREEINPYANAGPVEISETLRPKLHEKVSQICLYARRDLHIRSPREPNSRDIAGMLFDDFEK